MATKIAPSPLTVVPPTPAVADQACEVLADALGVIGRPIGSGSPADIVTAAICANPSVTLEDLAGHVAAAASRHEAVARVAAALTGHPSARPAQRRRSTAHLALVGHDS